MIVLDETHLMDICGGDREFWAAILEEYVADGRANLENIKASLDGGDESELGTLLHRFKGSSGSAGAREMAELLGSLESVLQSGGPEAVRNRLSDLDFAWSRVLDQVDRTLGMEAA